MYYQSRMYFQIFRKHSRALIVTFFKTHSFLNLDFIFIFKIQKYWKKTDAL